jgi:CBS domain-containing protein
VTDRVGSLSGREPVLAEADETLRSVARKLWSESVGIVVVGDARHPLGVISERDVVAVLAQGADPDAMAAREAMTNHIISARRHDPLFDAAGQMLDDAIRHLPVVDENGAVVGMVSVRDLLRPLLLDALSGGETSTEEV